MLSFTLASLVPKCVPPDGALRNLICAAHCSCQPDSPSGEGCSIYLVASSVVTSSLHTIAAEKLLAATLMSISDNLGGTLPHDDRLLQPREAV